MRVKEIFEKFKQKFTSKYTTNIEKIHWEIIQYNKAQSPHHNYWSEDFLFSDLQNLNPQELETLDVEYQNWDFKEQYVLKHLISRYSKEILNLKTWLHILYKDDFTSCSENLKTLLIYHFILQNERCDSEYWMQGHGGTELNYEYFEVGMLNNDWVELKKDLPNWKYNQLNILMYCIINCESRYDTGDYEASTILDRFELLPTLLKINRQKTNFTNNIPEPLWNTPEFLNQGPPKSKKSLLDIAKYCGYTSDAIYSLENNNNQFILELRQALEVAIDDL